jgi:hypothetical protein
MPTPPRDLPAGEIPQLLGGEDPFVVFTKLREAVIFSFRQRFIPPFTERADSQGRVVTLDWDPPLDVILSGNSSPYSWQGRYRDPDGPGGWTMYPGEVSGTENAFEVNDTPGLEGKAALIYPRGLDTWTFQHVRMGGYYCNPTVQINVWGCAQLPDAVVTFTKGSRTISCTTVLFPGILIAACFVTLDSAGTWAVKVTHPDYVDWTGTITVDCSGHFVISATLTPTDPGLCGPCGIPPGTTTLHLFDGFAMRTLTLSTVVGTPDGSGWSVCLSDDDLPVTVYKPNCTDVSDGSLKTKIVYIVYCDTGFDSEGNPTAGPVGLHLRIQSLVCSLFDFPANRPPVFLQSHFREGVFCWNLIDTPMTGPGPVGGEFYPASQTSPLAATFNVAFPDSRWAFYELWPSTTAFTLSL